MFNSFFGVCAALWSNPVVQYIGGACFLLGTVLCALRLVNRGRLDG